MDWSALGAISEIISALAVIVTLIYLSKQIKNNTKEVKTENIHRVTDSFNQINILIAGNADLADVWWRGFESFDDLNDKEKSRLNFLLLSVFRIYDSLYYQIKHGTGDEELWSTELETLDFVFSSQGHRQWWKQNHFGFSSGFRQFIEKNYFENSQ